jgi:hypothetical protein
MIIFTEARLYIRLLRLVPINLDKPKYSLITANNNNRSKIIYPTKSNVQLEYFCYNLDMLTFYISGNLKYQKVAAGRLKKQSVRHTATAATTIAAPPPHHANTAASAWWTHPANGGGSLTPVAFWI